MKNSKKETNCQTTTNEIKALELKNYFLWNNPIQGVYSLYIWLHRQTLEGKQSRARTRFMKILEERIKEINDVLISLQQKYAERNAEGKIIYLDGDKEVTEITDPNKNYIIKIKDQKAFEKEWQEYMNESFIIDITPATRDTIYTVKEILLNTSDKFTGAQASLYYEWCEAFEKI